MKRSRSDRARMLVIAALPREGRVQRAIRRCFIAGNGRPRSSADFLRWAYPKLDHAQVRHFGRGPGRGRPVIWVAKSRSTAW